MGTPMDRRAFLRRASLVAAGAVAADQLELLDRIGWKRRLFAGLGIGAPTLYGDGIHDDTAALQALCDGRKVYSARSRLLIGGTSVVALPRGYHRVSSTIELAPGRTIEFNGSGFGYTRPVDSYVHVQQGATAHIAHCTFTGPHARVGLLFDGPSLPLDGGYRWTSE